MTLGAFSCDAQTPLLQHIRELSSDKYQGRKTGTQGSRMAADYIVRQFKALGLKSFNGSYKHPFSFKAGKTTVTGANLIAFLPGKKQKAIVISAHYDHLGVKNGKIYNGADDDASGVGGILEIAAYFAKHKPEHTLIFVAFDAEEMGLQGAKAFVSRSPVPLSRIRLNINLDMVSHNDKGELYVAGTHYYPELKSYLSISSRDLKLLTGHDDPSLGPRDDWTNQGDHGAFHGKRIPFLYFGVEDHQDYHQPTDDFERINKQFYADAVKAILDVIRNYDSGMTSQKMFQDRQIMR